MTRAAAKQQYDNSKNNNVDGISMAHMTSANARQQNGALNAAATRNSVMTRDMPRTRDKQARSAASRLALYMRHQLAVTLRAAQTRAHHHQRRDCHRQRNNIKTSSRSLLR